jgi:23S rRNA (cytidine1920-2'-O)/16S rRNA (cytidine1409-2'-O)-methyltransferase
MAKVRLDNLLLEKNLADSLKISQSLIICGNVLVNDLKITKSGHLVDPDSNIRILKESSKYVSRGGEKLAGAHQAFGFIIKDRIALDVGISTGGFTDFLLQNGIKFVFGIDVAYGLIDYKIRQNNRLVLLERTNARTLELDMLKKALKKRPELLENLSEIDLVVMDVSFISILKVLPAIKQIVKSETDYIILVKPQFEAEKEQIEEGGLITKPEVHHEILQKVKEKLAELGFVLKAECESPIFGTKGNKEFFFWLQTSPNFSKGGE